MADERTVYVANFTDEITEDLLEELFTQAGPVVKVILRDVQSSGSKFALVEFEDEPSVLFAIELMDGVKLHGLPIQVKPRNGSAQETLYRQKRGEIMERQRSTPVSTDRYSRGDRSGGDRDRDRDRDRRGNSNQSSWRHRDSLPPPPPPPGGSWRNDRHSTPQLLPHQQFMQHMMQQNSAPPSYNSRHHQNQYHRPPPPPPQHHPYQTPRRHDRQGYDRSFSRDSGRRQGGGGRGGGRY